MKQIISLCGVFLATALIIPVVISLTYKKANESILPPQETQIETEAESAAAEQTAAETTSGFDWSVITAEKTETESETEPAVMVYNEKPSDETAVDRYTLYGPEFDIEWNEEEERVLGPMTEPEPETEPETTEEETAPFPVITVPETTKAPETTVPETTKAPETTAAETTKAPETTAAETTKAPETTKAHETAAEETAKAPETTFIDPIGPDTIYIDDDDPDYGAIVEKYEMPQNDEGKYIGCDATYLKVYVRASGKYIDMLMGDYLVGVIAAEMPVKFDLEALKAQAVASRTFSLYKAMSDSYYHASSHGPRGADVCTNSGHCQAYLPYESAVKSWGDREYVDSIYAKIKRAVVETSGIVLTRNGELIESVYHASSYGRTDSMANIWGGYDESLVGASTPETLDTAYVYSKEVFTAAKVKELVRSVDRNAEFSSDPSDWMKITLNDNGRVKTLKVGSVTLSGQTSKGLFELSSNNFKVSYDKDTGKFTFEVYGWGHGVGMSQYGAGIYAAQGKTFDFILEHYYNNADLTIWY